MAILTFVLGAMLFAAGGYSLYMSVDLIPTEMGQVYALSGVILVSVSFAVWAVAALITRLDRIFVAPRPPGPPGQPRAAPPENPVVGDGSPSAPSDEPAAPKPEVVARYSADGGVYALLSNGAIEAETPEGALRFASMDEFKAYIASRKS